MFQPNLGAVDRTVRIVAGTAILALAFVGPQSAWGYLGLVPLITGIVGFCPAYCPLGLRTCQVPKS